MSKLLIKGELPSLNEYIAADKTNRYVGGRMKRESTNLVKLTALNQKLPKIEKLSDFNFIYYCKNRKKDKDNISATARKFIFDGLVAANLLPNDGWDYVGDIYESFMVDPDNPRIEVFITEVPL